MSASQGGPRPSSFGRGGASPEPAKGEGPLRLGGVAGESRGRRRGAGGLGVGPLALPPDRPGAAKDQGSEGVTLTWGKSGAVDFPPDPSPQEAGSRRLDIEGVMSPTTLARSVLMERQVRGWDPRTRHRLPRRSVLGRPGEGPFQGVRGGVGGEGRDNRDPGVGPLGTSYHLTRPQPLYV